MSTAAVRNLQTRPDTRVLFLDLLEVEKLEGLVQNVTEAEKHPLNPVLPLGDLQEWDSTQARPWESRTVLYDPEEGLFKCWYAGADLTPQRWWRGGYATSEDGVRWRKPKLGLYEYNGSKENNYDSPEGRAKLKRFVDDEALGNDTLWSYIDARDVAAACQSWLESDHQGAEVFNLAASNMHQEVSMAQLLERHGYRGVPVGEWEGEDGTLFSTRKIRGLLNWQARYDWREILERV